MIVGLEHRCCLPIETSCLSLSLYSRPLALVVSLPDSRFFPFLSANVRCFPCSATALLRDMRTGFVVAPGGADARPGAFPRGRAHLEL